MVIPRQGRTDRPLLKDNRRSWAKTGAPELQKGRTERRTCRQSLWHSATSPAGRMAFARPIIQTNCWWRQLSSVAVRLSRNVRLEWTRAGTDAKSVGPKGSAGDQRGEARTLKAFCSAAQGCPTTVGLPWVREKECARTLKGFCRTLIPNVALIELNAVFPEETAELVLERLFTMVLVLVPNIFLQDDVEIDLAERLRHRESSR